MNHFKGLAVAAVMSLAMVGCATTANQPDCGTGGSAATAPQDATHDPGAPAPGSGSRGGYGNGGASGNASPGNTIQPANGDPAPTKGNGGAPIAE